jgi:hypothetical protein
MVPAKCGIKCAKSARNGETENKLQALECD